MAAELYALALAIEKLGYGLWEPGANGEYKRIRIGDVGYVYRGFFHRLFNILLSADDPLQNLGVPEYFEPLVLPAGSTTYRLHPLQSEVHTNEIKVTRIEGKISTPVFSGPAVDLKFECSKENGAVLVFPDEGLAERTDCHFRNLYGKYMLKHYKTWLAFANDVRHCGLKGVSDLILVTGCDMTDRWAMALFSQEGHQARVAVEASIAGYASATFGMTSGWHANHSVEHRYGPLLLRNGRPTAQIVPPSDSNDWDQCVFIRGFRVKERAVIWPKVIEAAAGPAPLPDADRNDDFHDAVRASDTDDQHKDDSSVQLETFGTEPQSINLLSPILDYILESTDATVAIAHDEDLWPFVHDSAKPEVVRSVLQRDQPSVKVVDGVGSIHDLDASSEPSESHLFSEAESVCSSESLIQRNEPVRSPRPLRTVVETVEPGSHVSTNTKDMYTQDNIDDKQMRRDPELKQTGRSVGESNLQDKFHKDSKQSHFVDPSLIGNNDLGGVASRKQTLLTLLTALNELTNDGHFPEGKSRVTSDITSVGQLDEAYQDAGSKAFFTFERNARALDKELRHLTNSARSLGSSAALLSSAVRLRDRLAQVLFIFHENASDLFPRKVPRPQREETTIRRTRFGNKRIVRKHVSRLQASHSLDPEDFPVQFESLARDVIALLESLDDFPEFQDEELKLAITSFNGDLMYWASCLKVYEGQFRFPAVQRYLFDLSAEMNEHLLSLSLSIGYFASTGIVIIRHAQKHTEMNLLGLSVISLLLAIVTVIGLSLSYQQAQSPLTEALNAMWFIALIFSVAASVNSLLGMTWTRATYRSPGYRIPKSVSMWTKQYPPVFLVVSAILFLSGLVLLSYSLRQGLIVRVLTTVFAGAVSFGFTTVSGWIISEKLVYIRYKGQKYLADTVTSARSKLALYSGIQWMKEIWPHAIQFILRATRASIRRAGMTLSRAGSWEMADLRSRDDSLHSLSSYTLTPGVAQILPLSTGTTASASATAETAVDPTASRLRSTWSPPVAAGVPNSSAEDITGVPGSDGYPAKRRFANAVRSVMMMRAASSPAREAPVRESVYVPESHIGRVPLRSRHTAALGEELKRLHVVQSLQPHQALIRHLQFSPDGSFLATASWDRTSVILRVGDPLTTHRTLAHPQGFVSQLAWSPKGDLILTKLSRMIKIWTQDGVCKKSVDRGRSINAVAWLPGGEAFLTTEGSHVMRLDLLGKIHDSYNLEGVQLHDIAVTADSERFLAVGTLLESANGLHPSKAKAEKRIIAYNMDEKEIECQVPILREVRNISLSKNDGMALVSFEGQAPPQLWRLEMIKRRDKVGKTTRLTLLQTYATKTTIDFAGPSYFGGRNDELVFSAGKVGDIYVWHRDSGQLLHQIETDAALGDLTCIGWNRGTNSFMLAAGTHEGSLQLWTSKPVVAEQESEAAKGKSRLYSESKRPDSPLGPDLPSYAREYAAQLDSTSRGVTSLGMV